MSLTEDLLGTVSPASLLDYVAGSIAGIVKVEPYVPPGVGTSSVVVGANVGTQPTPEEYLEYRVDLWKKRLGLSDWQVWVEFAENSKTSNARISFNPYQFQAVIFLNKDQPQEQWDWDIVHELLHIVLYSFQSYAEELLLHTGDTERAILDSHMEGVMEPMINRLCRSIVGVRPRMGDLVEKD